MSHARRETRPPRSAGTSCAAPEAPRAAHASEAGAPHPSRRTSAVPTRYAGRSQIIHPAPRRVGDNSHTSPRGASSATPQASPGVPPWQLGHPPGVGVGVSHTDRRPPRGRGSKCREGVKSRPPLRSPPPPAPPSELVGGLGRAAPPLRPAGAAQPPCPGSRYPAGGGGARGSGRWSRAAARAEWKAGSAPPGTPRGRSPGAA